MSHSQPNEKDGANKQPSQQTDESHGSVTKEQVSDQSMQREDLARGSEVETRESSNRRS